MMATTTQATTVARHPFFDFNDAADVILPRHDKDEIRSRLLEQLESVLLYLFPHGKRRGSQFFIGNLHGEPGDSLVVELAGPKRGLWFGPPVSDSAGTVSGSGQEKRERRGTRGGREEEGLPCDHTSIGAVSREGHIASYLR